MTTRNGEEGPFRETLASPVREQLSRLSTEYRRRFSSFDENDPETSEVSIPSEAVLPKQLGCVFPRNTVLRPEQTCLVDRTVAFVPVIE